MLEATNAEFMRWRTPCWEGTRNVRGQTGFEWALPQAVVRLSEVLAGLSYALDLSEGQRPGHAVRSCAIGMRLAEIVRLPAQDRSSLFHALLMKDLGSSSNASRLAALFAADDQPLKASLSLVDWTNRLDMTRWVARNVAPTSARVGRLRQALSVLSHGARRASELVRTRSERGAEIARLLGFSEVTAQAIRALDEHWDGRGQPYGVTGTDIPLVGRIVLLAETAEVLSSTYGVDVAYDVVGSRRGTWFDPDLVDGLSSIREDVGFWRWLGSGNESSIVASVEPTDQLLAAEDDYIDLIAEAFAKVIDAKSPWSGQHSTGVAELSVAIANSLGFSPKEVRDLRRAALLHDLGKLGISSLILDKPAKLTAGEFEAVRRHPEHTYQILSRIGCFRHVAGVAASHHERLDGHGYHRALPGSALPMAARVLCMADICDALRTARPYRPGLPVERVLEVMGREVGAALDPDCYRALEAVIGERAPARVDSHPSIRAVSALAEDYHQAA